MPKHSAIIDHNEEWGITKIFHRHHDGDWTYQTIQDVEPIIEANKAAQNDKPFIHPVLGRRVASIPLVLILEIEKKHGINFYNKDHKRAFLDLLNSNEYRHFRTDNSVL
jgi:hypothetical protein